MPATPMTEVRASMRAGADRIFAELADGWAYVGWVVGASHIRDVDAGWPEVGSKIHHKVGVWPLVIADDTESLVCEPGRRLLMRAKGWPLGEATVEIVLDQRSPSQTEVTLREAPTAGPGHWLDNPVQRWLLRLRNRETLRRLADRVEHRPRPGRN
ncbi:SRPBCC family protein [Jatrophihabitans sp.]|uniref:SRPBCC family protein n=1 Tax=Jatrophihabitans sp. TaxID=1932789 RepID=UPI002C53D72E|nr:SRPBCC family protein [Jatrophihabitans sp.]